MSIIYWDNAQQIAISVGYFFDCKLPILHGQIHPLFQHPQPLPLFGCWDAPTLLAVRHGALRCDPGVYWRPKLHRAAQYLVDPRHHQKKVVYI